MTVRDLLSDNLQHLLRKYRLRKPRDFARLDPLHSRRFFRPLRKKLASLPFAESVRFDYCPHTPASSYFRVQFRGKTLGGMSIQISHIAAVYRWQFVPPEWFSSRIDFKTPLDEGKYLLQQYKKGLPKRIPKKAVVLAEKVLDELTPYGLIGIPNRELDRSPDPSTKIPSALRKYSFSFFFFESIPYFP